MISIKKLDSLAYYDEIKDTNELKSYEDLDELYSEKRGFWYDKDGIFDGIIEDGEIIQQVKKGQTSSLNLFCQGYNPKTGAVLVDPKSAGPTRRPGYDFTQSAPKWVSVLYSQADEQKRAIIEEIIKKSAKAGVDALNTYGGMTRSGKAGIEFVKSSYAAALYMDFTARPTIDSATGAEQIDPQLHCHTIIPNVSACLDGKFRAVDGPTMMKLQVVMAETFHATMADEFRKLGFELKNELVAFDSEEVPDVVKEAFSRRREQVKEALEQMGYDRSDREQARKIEQLAVVEGRARHSIQSKEDIEQQWKERGIALSFTSKDVDRIFSEAAQRRKRALARPDQDILNDAPTPETTKKSWESKEPEPPVPGAPIKDEDVRAILDHLLETESVVSDAKFRTSALGYYTGANAPADINAAVDKTLNFYARSLEKIGPISMITTQEMIDIEREMVDIAITYKRPNHFDEKIIDKEIAAFKARVAAEGKTMSAQQEESVRFLASNVDGVVSIQGRAGSGKSFTLGALRSIAGACDWQIVGTSLSWAASRNLADEGKLDNAAAIADFVHRIQSGKLSLDDRTVIVVDEAGIVGSRDMHKILRAAKEAGSVVVLTGDPLQIASVSAGGAFRTILTEKEKISGNAYRELNEVRRQKADWDKEAGLKLSAGNAAEAIHDYMLNGREVRAENDFGRIRIETTQERARNLMFAEYMEDRRKHPQDSRLMIAKTNADVDSLNLMIHSALQQSGELGEDTPIETLKRKGKSKTKMTSNFATGDLIQFRRKSNELTSEDGEEVQVYNRTRAKILEINGSGREVELVAQLYSGDKLSDTVIRISNKDFRDGYLEIEQAHCMTSESAQGQTYDRSFVMGGAQFDRSRAYVISTRHREDLKIYIDLDTMHTIASSAWSNEEYILRKAYTPEMAIQTLADRWSTEKDKVTTIDYINGNLAKARETRRTAKKQSVKDLAEMVEASQLEKLAVCINPGELESKRRRIWNAFKTQYLVVSEKARSVKSELRQAVSVFGAALHLTGDKAFHKLAAKAAREMPELGLLFSSKRTTEAQVLVKKEAEKVELKSQAKPRSPGVRR